MTGARRRAAAWWLLVLSLTSITVGAAALGGWQMQVKSQRIPADQPADRQAATQAASTGAVKVLSYSADSLDRDFSAAEGLLTGDFLAYYMQFTSQVVAPAAQQKRMTTTAAVVRTGVESLSNRRASILVFVMQTTTSQDTPTPPSNQSSSVRVGLSNVNGVWLINAFDPV